MRRHAIETLYDGHWFKSRLDAQWALFFDRLAITYEYGKRNFDFDGIVCHPTFWLPAHHCWIMVKEQKETQSESRDHALLALYTQKPVYVFEGPMWTPGVDDTYTEYYGEEQVYGVRYKKGASIYDPLACSLVVHDTASPCHKQCIHTARKEPCPAYRFVYPPDSLDAPLSDISLTPEQGHLLSVVYIADILMAPGDSCKLRLHQGSLCYLVPEYGVAQPEKRKKTLFLGRKLVDLPVIIARYKKELEDMLAQMPDTWEWGIGACGNILFPLNVYRWCEENGICTLASEGVDATPRLLAAYTEARQAHFEQRELPQ